MPNQWSSNAAVYVAFLDVLGFGKLVLNNSHADLEQIYTEALMEGVGLGLSNRQYALIENGGQEYLTNDTSAVPVNSLIVSDTIILWTNCDSVPSFRKLVSVVRGVLAHSCFNGLPLRGAIEVGPMSWGDGRFNSQNYNMQQAIFGSGLVKAHELEKRQDWSGCVIGNGAIQRLREVAGEESFAQEVNMLISKKELCEYTVPFKDGCRSMLALDWVNHPEVQARSSTVANAFLQHGKIKDCTTLTECSSIRQKLDNTVRFVRYVNPSADKEGMEMIWEKFNR